MATCRAVTLAGLLVLSAGCLQAQPEATVRSFVTAMERWDTEKMASLYCPSQQEKARSGLFWAGAFLGLGSLVGIDIKGIKVEEARYETKQTGEKAEVRLTGRVVLGFPIGSQKVDTTFRLSRESGQWCITE